MPTPIYFFYRTLTPIYDSKTDQKTFAQESAILIETFELKRRFSQNCRFGWLSLAAPHIFQEYEETCLFTQHNSLQANLFEYIPKFIKTPHHSLVVGASPKWGSPMRVGEREPALRSIILSLLALRSDVSIELALYFISSCLFFLYLHSFFINYCFCHPLITL